MKQVRLTISGLDDVTQKVERAEYSIKNGCYFILYRDNLEGFEGCSSRIKCREGYLELTRDGARNVRMVFEEGKEYCMAYPTPFGSLDIKISTNSVRVAQDGDSLEALVEYEIGGDNASARKFQLKLEPIT